VHDRGDRARGYRQPEGHEAVGERRHDGGASAHPRERERSGQPGLDQPEPAGRDRKRAEHLRGAEREQDE